MASIFTYDPDPPRVSSPWSSSRASTPRDPPVPQPQSKDVRKSGDNEALKPKAVLDTDALVTRLEAEPQEGPTEYKLHLLLRPRRCFTISTSRNSRSSHGKSLGNAPSRSGSETPLSRTPPKAASTHSRQHRLEQLTTQLLWRLQQSSPYHASTANELVIPQLPEAGPQLEAPRTLGKLVPGLEESKGALYEIGVADDGTFVGLAEDEMGESLANLRAMAASLGCIVEVLRMVPVGECEWYEELVETNTNPAPTRAALVPGDVLPQVPTRGSGPPNEADAPLHLDAKDVRLASLPASRGTPATRVPSKLRIGKLWVAEAFIKPDVRSAAEISDSSMQAHPLVRSFELDNAGAGSPNQPLVQLRVSLTGATMSGKSSLLGSLSTATLDNGRGKSRLSLLKHRHEIVSGMTSSVTQELIGYHETAAGSGDVQVVNYASGNVSSWNDIHAACQSGRLVFLSDSAGHPRYRRTTVRGLMGWGPHFTLLCMPADNTEDTCGKSGSTPSAEEVLGAGAADVDLSEAHLHLCLKLRLPLIVVVTKLDLASNRGVKQSVSKVLTALKAAGRKPELVVDSTALVPEEALGLIPAKDLAHVSKIAGELAKDPLGTVPVVLTSAVRGTGIRKLHALLHELQIPEPATPPPDAVVAKGGNSIQHGVPPVLYHVEDVYKLRPISGLAHDSSTTSIISGHLRYGTLSLGDELVLGPYPTAAPSADDSEDSSGSPLPHRRATSTSTTSTTIPSSRSFPGALHPRLAGSLPLHLPPKPKQNTSEWRRVRVSSIRNLRLPVRTLHAGQVGTLGLEPVDCVPTSASTSAFTSAPASPPAAPAPSLARLRKGMVLANTVPASRHAFAARFPGAEARSLIVGSLAVVYIASVRASAKVVAIAIADEGGGGGGVSSLSSSSSAGVPDPGPAPRRASSTSNPAFGFEFSDDSNSDDGRVEGHVGGGGDTLVTFAFVATREFVEGGAQVLVMEGGRRGNNGSGGSGGRDVDRVGLEGFVGTVVCG